MINPDAVIRMVVFWGCIAALWKFEPLIVIVLAIGLVVVLIAASIIDRIRDAILSYKIRREQKERGYL